MLRWPEADHHGRKIVLKQFRDGWPRGLHFFGLIVNLFYYCIKIVNRFSKWFQVQKI